MAEFEKKIKMTDIVPTVWFSDRTNSSVWISAFRSVGGSISELSKGVVFDLIGARAFALQGQLSYLDTTGMQWEWNDQGIPVCNAEVKNVKTPFGSYLVIMTPYKIDGVDGKESEVKRIISSSAGLVASFSGRNSVYEKIFDNVLELGKGNLSGFGPVFVNPKTSPPPDFSENRLSLIGKGIAQYYTLDLSIRNRISLALHWYAEALNDQGRDAFLKAWIALEVLSMPDSTNIRKINESLARAYSIPYDEIVSRYCVGLIFGLRSRIVHDGDLIPIHYLIEEYTMAIFVDVLFDILNIASDRKTEAILSKPDFDLKAFLNRK